MRGRLLSTIFFAMAAWTGVAHAQPVTTINLLTVGPGDELFTRQGHSALLVMTTVPGQAKFDSTVYNFGVADFSADGFFYRFLRGRAPFRLAETGSLASNMERFAGKDRTVVVQRLNLTEAQVALGIARLKANARPEAAEYAYHHLHANCATRVRDLIDELTGGALRAHFASLTDPSTIRERARLNWAGSLTGELFNELLVGRLHDAPIDRYQAMYDPAALSSSLQELNMPDPKGGAKQVPLLEAPRTLYQQKARVTFGQGKTPLDLARVLIAVLGLLGVGIWWNWPRSGRLAGAWVLSWALPLGLVGIGQTFLLLVSTVPELRWNELVLAFPVTDLALLPLAWRWWRGRLWAGAVARNYAWLRLALVLAALIAQAAGVFYQRPRVFLLLALVCSTGLVLFTQRCRREPD